MATADQPLHMLRLQVCSMLLPVLFYLASFMTAAVDGLSCVQCVSVNMPRCVRGDIAATVCQGPDAESKYCLKSVGSQVSANGHIVTRSCSRSLQTNCTKMLFSGDLYDVCHHSCSHDGCNRAPSRCPMGIGHLPLVCMIITANLLVAKVLRPRH